MGPGSRHLPARRRDGRPSRRPEQDRGVHRSPSLAERLQDSTAHASDDGKRHGTRGHLPRRLGVAIRRVAVGGDRSERLPEHSGRARALRDGARTDRRAGPRDRTVRADVCERGRQPRQARRELESGSRADRYGSPVPMSPEDTTMTPTNIETVAADPLTERVRATWTAGDFGRIAKGYERGAGEFIARLELATGDRVLDVACGTGNLALPAARTGATVSGIDIAPNLIDQARSRAAEEGLTIAL